MKIDEDFKKLHGFIGQFNAQPSLSDIVTGDRKSVV